MIGSADFQATAWRADSHVPAHVVVVPSNFGQLGSLADYRRRQTATIIAPPEPRLRAWNALLPVLFRQRVVDTAKNAGVASVPRAVYGLPANFTTPRAASLNGRLPL